MRDKAKVVLVLMEDDEKLKEERAFAVKTREKTSKSSGGQSPCPSAAFTPGFDLFNHLLFLGCFTPSNPNPAASEDAVKDPTYQPCYVAGATGLPSLDNIPSVADLTASFAARKEERLKQEAEKKEAARRVSVADLPRSLVQPEVTASFSLC